MVEEHDEPEDQYRDAYEQLQEIERELDELNQATDGMDTAISNVADNIHDIRRDLSVEQFEQELYL